MKFADFTQYVVADSVKNAMGAYFYTNELANHPAMRKAHQAHAATHSYYQMLGRYLHKYATELHVQLLPESEGKRGSGRRWRRTDLPG